MKYFVGLALLLSFSQAEAKSATLRLAGTVPLKAEVSIDPVSKTFVSSSSPQMKVELQKRHVASIIRVSAP